MYYQKQLLLLASRNQPRRFQRAISAKVKSARQRPQSQSHSRGNKTTEMANANMKQVNGSFVQSKNNLLGYMSSQVGKQRRQSAKITQKNIEQLYEENMILKKQNNRLMDELMQVKGKFQVKSKRVEDRGKQLDLEFEKQIYWTGSKTYMISGIKHQYHKLKKNYEEQSKQVQNLKRVLRETKVMECQVEIDKLHEQNQRLAQIIKKMQQKNLNFVLGIQKYPNSMPSNIQQQNNEKIQKEMEQLAKNVEYWKQALKQKQTKILFLQKLLIQKDNRDFYACRKIKKIQKYAQQLKQANSKLSNDLSSLSSYHQGFQEQLRKKFEADKQQTENRLKSEIKDLKSKVQYLQQDKKQLQGNLNKMRRTATLNANRQLKEKRNNQMGNNLNSAINSNVRMDSSLQQPHKINSISLFNNSHDVQQTQSVLGNSEDENDGQNKNEPKQRVMQTADKKHSKDAQKTRKVQYSQVTQIAELIKYRMISAGLTIEGMKKYFNKHKSDGTQFILQNAKQQEQKEASMTEWDDQYISMKQTKDILQATPFNLQQNAAHLMARYVIEDCNEQFVYCDQGNENKRQIVKSILKATIGDYELTTQKQIAEIQDFKLKYLSNLYSALKTYYPNGKVGKKKFMEVLVSMGTELSDKAQDTLLSKIVAKSLNLTQLQYNVLNQI